MNEEILAWDKSYNIQNSPNLWGDSVPYIEEVVTIFNNNYCKRIIDIPCGDGRNTIPLSIKLPFIVAADSSNNALSKANQIVKMKHLENCIIQISNRLVPEPVRAFNTAL